MSESPDHEARITRLEARVEEVAADAAAARHLAAMNDRDLADVGVKLDANRKAINALDEQTRARFDEVDRRFERLESRVDAGFAFMNAKFAEYDQGFAAMRHGFDQTAAGFARIEQLLTARDDDR
jgi:hypothetical protein